METEEKKMKKQEGEGAVTQHPPGPGRGGWRWWASLALLEVISVLPAVWGVWCTAIFLFLFPITHDKLLDTGLMLLVLLSFIASAVRRDPNDPAKKLVWAVLGVLTAYHGATGALFPLWSPSSVVYFLWLATALSPFFDPSLGRHTRTWSTFQRLPVWNWMERDYFPITVTRTQELDPSRRYIFAYHPHGLWTWGLWTALVSEQFRTLFPSISWRILVATPLLMLPGAGHFIHWIGGISATAESAGESIKAGHSIVVIPGGLAEAILSSPTEPAILLKARRGFVRLAIQNGTPLVPMYGFGETSLFSQVSFWRERRLRWSRLLGFPVTIFTGMLGSPAPVSHPVHVVVGAPIEVAQKAAPTDEEVAQLHAHYEAQLVALYDAHKPAHDAPLRIY